MNIERCIEIITNVLYVDEIKVNHFKVNHQELKEIIESDINFNGDDYIPSDEECKHLVLGTADQGLIDKFPDTYSYLQDIC